MLQSQVRERKRKIRNFLWIWKFLKNREREKLVGLCGVVSFLFSNFPIFTYRDFKWKKKIQNSHKGKIREKRRNTPPHPIVSFYEIHNLWRFKHAHSIISGVIYPEYPCDSGCSKLSPLFNSRAGNFRCRRMFCINRSFYNNILL